MSILTEQGPVTLESNKSYFPSSTSFLFLCFYFLWRETAKCTCPFLRSCYDFCLSFHILTSPFSSVLIKSVHSLEAVVSILFIYFFKTPALVSVILPF